MLQDYKLEIGFDNCSYDSPYLVEGCANSCITLIIDSEKFPTLQSKKNVQEELQNVIKGLYTMMSILNFFGTFHVCAKRSQIKLEI